MPVQLRRRHCRLSTPPIDRRSTVVRPSFDQSTWPLRASMPVCNEPTCEFESIDSDTQHQPSQDFGLHAQELGIHKSHPSGTATRSLRWGCSLRCARESTTSLGRPSGNLAITALAHGSYAPTSKCKSRRRERDLDIALTPALARSPPSAPGCRTSQRPRRRNPQCRGARPGWGPACTRRSPCPPCSFCSACLSSSCCRPCAR